MMVKSIFHKTLILFALICFLSIFWSSSTRSEEVTLKSPPLSPRQYQMISVPFRVDNPDPVRVFGDNFGGAYNPIIWRLFRQNPERGRNMEYPQVPDVSPGIAYWLITRDGGVVEATGTLVTDETYPLDISPGWFQLGNPYTSDVLKDSLKVILTETAITSITVPLSDPASPIDDVLWKWDGSSSAWMTVDRMFPWEGYYIYNTNLTPVTLLIPNPTPGPGAGSLQVTVVDALTGDVIEGVTVTFDGFTSTTDAFGIATIGDTSTGTFTLVVSKGGYIPYEQEITLEAGPNNVNISLSPQLATGQIRIVVTWGVTPEDLDSHLTGPDASGSRFHVYFADQNPIGASATLDLDDVTSFGPETITISELRSGTYKYYVHDYSNQFNASSTALAQSGARVDVYREEGLAASYAVPSGAGTIWHVFDLDGVTGGITPVNTISSGEVPLNAIVSEGGEGEARSPAREGDIFERLPKKLYGE